MLLLSEQDTRGVRKPSKYQCSFVNLGALYSKVLSLLLAFGVPGWISVALLRKTEDFGNGRVFSEGHVREAS